MCPLSASFAKAATRCRPNQAGLIPSPCSSPPRSCRTSRCQCGQAETLTQLPLRHILPKMPQTYRRPHDFPSVCVRVSSNSPSYCEAAASPHATAFILTNTPFFLCLASCRRILSSWWQRTSSGSPRDIKDSPLTSWTPSLRSWALNMRSTRSDGASHQSVFCLD